MLETCAPTPETVRQLNIEVIVSPNGQVISSRTRNKLIIDTLVECGYIDPYHAEYGFMLSTLRDVWLGRLGCSVSMLSDEISALCPHVSPHELYDKLISSIKPIDRKIIFWTIKAPSQPIPAKVGEICYRSFDLLAKAFTTLRE